MAFHLKLTALSLIVIFISILVCSNVTFDANDSDRDEETDRPPGSREARLQHDWTADDDDDFDLESRIVKFKPFKCDENRNRLASANLTYFTINEGWMYFYYKEFVIKHPLPEFYRNFDDEDDEADYESYHLVHPEPVYSEYRTMYTPPTILQQVDITAIMQVIYSSEKWTYALREHYTPDVPEEKRYFKLAYHVVYSRIIIGELEFAYHGLTDRVHKPAYRLGFVRWDYTKWFEISYNENRTQVFFELFENYYYRGELRREQNYQTRQLIYYEFVDGSINVWTGTLIEVDEANMIHISNYVFALVAPKTLKIASHDYLKMPLVDFFGCIHSLRDQKQFKGAFVVKADTLSHHRTFLFIDDFYLVLNYDLVEMMFLVFAEEEWDRWAKRVQFKKEDENPKRERISIKFIKHTRPDKVYLTFNPSQTYTIDLDSSASEPGQQITALDSERLTHSCLHSALTIDDKSFCFNSVTYLYKSEDNFQHVAENTKRRLISQLFADSDVNTNGERIEYVMNYRRENAPNKIVFVTLNYLLTFSESMFAAKQAGDDDFLLELTAKRNLTKDQYNRTQNCLWVRCAYCPMDLNTIQGDRPFALWEIMDELGFPLKNDTDLDHEMLELTRLTHDELAVLAKGSLTKDQLTELYYKYMPHIPRN